MKILVYLSCKSGLICRNETIDTKIKVMKIIDGLVWCHEVEKWVTPEEYEQNCKGVEYRIPGDWDDEPDFDWENEVLNGR